MISSEFAHILGNRSFGGNKDKLNKFRAGLAAMPDGIDAEMELKDIDELNKNRNEGYDRVSLNFTVSDSPPKAKSNAFSWENTSQNDWSKFTHVFGVVALKGKNVLMCFEDIRPFNNGSGIRLKVGDTVEFEGFSIPLNNIF